MPNANAQAKPGTRRVGRPAGSNRDASLAQILPAARGLFASQGYARTTVRDIAMAVDMTPAALYTYFPSKAGLYKATCDSAQELLLEKYRQVLEQGGNLQSQLARILDVALAAHRDDPSITALLAAIPLEAGQDKELASLMLDQQNATRALLTELFSAAQDRGEIASNACPADQAMTLVGAIAGIALLQNSNQGLDLPSSLAIFTDLINGQLFNNS